MVSKKLMIFQGGSVKADASGFVAGPLVRFSGPEDPDISSYKDFFDGGTDYDLDADEVKRLGIYYQHGQDAALKKTKLTRGSIKFVDKAFLAEAGYDVSEIKAEDGQAVAIWAEAQLDLSNKYQAKIHGLAQKGRMGWSSGAVSHLVERKSVGGGVHQVLRWPIGEASLTPTPAEPRNGAIASKSIEEIDVDDVSAIDGEPTKALELLDVCLKALEAIDVPAELEAVKADYLQERLQNALQWRMNRISGMAADLLAELTPIPAATPSVTGALSRLATQAVELREAL